MVDPLIGGGMKKARDRRIVQAMLCVASINVTSLTLARLESLLAMPQVQRSQMVFLQETRLQSSAVPWFTNAVQKYGWKVTLSKPPPKGARASVVQGGTAI